MSKTSYKTYINDHIIWVFDANNFVIFNALFSKYTRQQKHITGCNLEDNIDYQGFNIWGSGEVVESKEACARLSFSRDDALFWTFRKDNRQCYLKDSNSVKKENTEAVSGNRECGMGEQI